MKSTLGTVLGPVYGRLTFKINWKLQSWKNYDGKTLGSLMGLMHLQSSLSFERYIVYCFQKGLDNLKSGTYIHTESEV